MFSDHRKINTRHQKRENLSGKSSNIWKLHNMQLNNLQIKEEIEFLKKCLKLNDNENSTSKFVGNR